MNRSFRRKVIYLVAIGALLLPMSFFSQPSTTGSEDTPGSPGGYLARLRSDYGLSQANLGEIDPASEGLKLATLGMRGVAANVLWYKAIEAKKKEDWTTYRASLNQITKLQPNFTTVWTFQAHNLAYNISVEFDDYRDRYHWVIEGIEFLKEGTRYNRDNPQLLFELGWIISHKIGRSDEREQYRRLFRQDDDFHGSRRIAERDNWLVAKEWFHRAEDAVENPADIKGRSPVVFYSEAPFCQIYYAIMLEEEGTFGEVARVGWQRAADEWREFGNRDLPGLTGTIRLNKLPLYQQRVAAYMQRLEEIHEGVYRKVAESRLSRLTPRQRAVFEKPQDQWTEADVNVAREIGPRIAVTHRDAAEFIAAREPDKASQARALAERAMAAEAIARDIDNSRTPIAYTYWQQRCLAEMTPEAIRAHESFYAANQAYVEDLDLLRAKQLYEQGFEAWSKVVEERPLLKNDDRTVDDLIQHVMGSRHVTDSPDAPFIVGYANVLQGLDQELPEDFEFRYVIDRYEEIRPDRKRRPEPTR